MSGKYQWPLCAVLNFPPWVSYSQGLPSLRVTRVKKHEKMLCGVGQALTNFFVKGWILNILCFEGHKFSVTTIQLFHYSA